MPARDSCLRVRRTRARDPRAIFALDRHLYKRPSPPSASIYPHTRSPWSQMAPQEQYHVFSLPKELLESLVPRNIINRAPTPSRSPSPPAPTISTNAARACNICLGIGFTDVNEQRRHYRSDWHRYNVKMRLNGANAVSEAQFSQLVDGESL